MRRHARPALIATVTAAMATVAAGVGAPYAMAQQSLVVANPDDGGSYLMWSNDVVLDNLTTDISFVCAADSDVHASDGVGTIPSAGYENVTPANPADIGDVGSLTFDNCYGPLGPVAVLTGDFPWSSVHITSYDPVAGDAGRAYGYLGDVDLNASMSGCEFDVTGHMPLFYDNGEATLSLTPDVALPTDVPGLTVSDTGGCLGWWNDGDAFAVAASYAVEPAITITSP